MAKSIHNTIKETTIDIQHAGQDYTFDMPGWVNDFSTHMDDVDGLVEVARKHDCLHGLLHAGLQQLIINIRAKGRPADKKGQTQPMDVEAGQDRIDNYRMKPVPVPGAAKAITPDKAIAALKRAGFTEAAIKAMLEAQAAGTP